MRPAFRPSTTQSRNSPTRSVLVTALCLCVIALCFAALTHAHLDGPDNAEKVYSLRGHRWFEDAFRVAAISGDGKWALLGEGADLQLVSLVTGKEDPTRLRGGLNEIDSAIFCGRSKLLRHGKHGTENGWYLSSEANEFERVTLPSNAQLTCSDEGKMSAYFRSGAADGGLSVGDWHQRKLIAIKGVITGTAFSPDGQFIYTLAMQMDGASSLFRINAGIGAGDVETLARDLDTAWYRSPLSVSSDGRQVYLSLASEKAPNPSERQKPEARRFLNIYQFNLATKQLKELVQSQIDKTSPVEAARALFWSQNSVCQSIVAIPTAGGIAHEVVAGGEVPTWSPDSRQIGFAFGDWRLADWAINWDAGAVSVNAEARATSDKKVIIAGNHEDFPPEWSPDGKWIAFHSHRAPEPVAYYDAPGSADDIWLRRANDPSAPEIRLTDFGWEVGSPNWSPDGRRLLFSSLDRKGKPGIYTLWLTTVDLQTGRAVGSEKLSTPPEIHNPISAVWSPKGDEIAVDDQEAPGKQAIAIMSNDGKKSERVVSYKCDTYCGLDWTPDGKNIVYSAMEDGRMQIFSISRSGGSPKKLSNDAEGLLHPRVSPDGRWVACTKLRTVQEIWRKHL